MVKTVYKINGYIDGNFITWLQSQVGYIDVLQHEPYEVYVRFDHTMSQQETFRQALETRLSLNPDDIVKKDIISTEFMTLKNTTTPPSPPPGQINIYQDSNDGKIKYKKSDGSIINLESGGSGTPREELVAQWDVSSTKTNVSVVFVDIYTQTNALGKQVWIDFTGKTQCRVMLLWNKIGSGTQQVKVCDAANTLNILHIFTNVISGENDSGLVNLPAWAIGRQRVKIMVLSSINTDDPIFEGARIYLK